MLDDIIRDEFKKPKDEVVGFAADTCNTNKATMSMLKGNAEVADNHLFAVNWYPLAVFIMCICHTLDNAGSKFDAPLALGFINAWIRLLETGRAKRRFLEVAEVTSPSHSRTRWYS